MTATGYQSASLTDEAFPDIPKPGADCEVFDLPDTEYPSLPDSVTESSTTTFATEFEKAYASAKLDAGAGTSFSGFDGWDATVVDRTVSGVLVLVWVALDFSQQASGTEGTLAGSDNSSGWYYVTEEYAVRARGDGSEERPERGWVTVACGER